MQVRRTTDEKAYPQGIEEEIGNRTLRQAQDDKKDGKGERGPFDKLRMTRKIGKGTLRQAQDDKKDRKGDPSTSSG